MKQNQSLRVTEVFFSLQGEARSSGKPTLFIRLTGCPLRCHYCDSEYAFYGGERQTIQSLLDEVQQRAARYVCVTGGEPLAQPGCLDLLRLLCEQHCRVSLETSGAMDIAGVDARVDIVMDLKTPGSGECGKNRWQNIDLLRDKDQVKFVICDRRDYEWARMQIDHYRLAARVGEVLISPSAGQIDPAELAQWLIADNLPARFQLQLHKLLWGDKPGV